MNFKIVSMAGVASLVLAAGVQADLADQPNLNFADVSATAGTPAGFTTWQFWVPFTSPTDNLLSVGFSNVTVTGGTFFQSSAPFGSNFPNMAFVGFDETLAWDSWVTLDDAIMQGDASPDPEFALSDSSLAGGWFDSNPGTPVLAGIDNQVLIMQLTINEGANITGVVTAFTGDGNVSQEYNVVIPGPGSLALIGVAGLMGIRRRRA